MLEFTHKPERVLVRPWRCAAAAMFTLGLVPHADVLAQETVTEDVLAVEVVSTGASGSPMEPVPVCNGVDPQAAQKAREAGIAAYRKAMANDPPDTVALHEALAHFDAQCAAGDDMALEARASVLYALGRYCEAARSFDAFQITHPLSTLDEATKQRVQANYAMYYEHIGTLNITTDVPGAEIRVADGPWLPGDGRPHRVEPGTVVFEVRTATRPPIRRSATIAAGEVQQVQVSLQQQERELPPVFQTQKRDEQAKDAVESSPPLISLQGWLAIGSGAMAVTALGGYLWSDDRDDEYGSAGCHIDPSIRGCDGVESAFEAAQVVEVVGIVGAVGLAGTALVALLTDEDEDNTEISGCVPGVAEGVGLLCRATF